MDSTLCTPRYGMFGGLQEMDTLLASLTTYTSVLDPPSSRAVIAFGQSDKARGALQAVFEVCNRYAPLFVGQSTCSCAHTAATYAGVRACTDTPTLTCIRGCSVGPLNKLTNGRMDGSRVVGCFERFNDVGLMQLT